MKNDNIKAARAAAELGFMLTQCLVNLEYLDGKNAAEFEQIFATFHHDISVITHRVGEINSKIIHKYQEQQMK